MIASYFSFGISYFLAILFVQENLWPFQRWRSSRPISCNKIWRSLSKVRKLTCVHTVLSRAIAHGCSQLKLQNLRVGGYTENSLKWFNYPHARAHPGCEVSCHGTEWTCIVGSSGIRRHQSDTGESCIVLQSGPTRSLIAKFPQHSVITCSMRISCCRGKTLQMRPRTGVCKPLMPDVVSLSGPMYLQIYYTRI